jgi:hypothetical protein
MRTTRIHLGCDVYIAKEVLRQVGIPCVDTVPLGIRTEAIDHEWQTYLEQYASEVRRPINKVLCS